LEAAKIRGVNGSLEASCADGHHAAEARGVLEKGQEIGSESRARVVGQCCQQV
jgi:hypothetical protein